jgi:hypothetical protein
VRIQPAPKDKTRPSVTSKEIKITFILLDIEVTPSVIYGRLEIMILSIIISLKGGKGKKPGMILVGNPSPCPPPLVRERGKFLLKRGITPRL